MARIRKQPQGIAAIDWTNPITRGLAFAFVHGASATGFCVNGDRSTYYRNASQVSLPFGTGAKLNSSSFSAYNIGGANGINTTTYSLFAVAATTPAATGATYNVIDLDNGSPRYFQFRLDSGKVNFIPFDTSAATTGVCTSSAFTAAELAGGFTMGATASPTRTACFKNGVLGQAATPTNLIAPTYAIPISIGARASSTAGWWLGGGIGMVAAWARTLSDAEMASLHANPWQLFIDFEDDYIEVDYATATAGGPTITSASGSSVGVANLTAVARAIANAVGSSTGTSALASSTISLFYADGSTSGSSTNAANGVSVYLTSGASTSTATVSGNAYSIWSVQANTVGSAGGTGSGVSLFPVAGGTAGTSSVSGSGSALTPASGSASGTAVGTSSAAAIASAFYNAIASAVGSASASGSGASTNSAVANASGSASGSGSSVARAATSGTTSGTSAANGGGVILACASGAATGLANVGGLSVAIYGAEGISVSAAQVQAIAASVASAFANAEGRSTVSGITEGGLHYTASGDKFSITLTLSPYKLKLNDSPFKLTFNN